MNQHCIDVFAHYDLPFATFFSKGVNHITQVHDELELIWVLRGDVIITCNDQVFQMGSQTLFVVNPFQIHTVKSSDDSMIITYRFLKEYLSEYTNSYKGLTFTNKVNTLDELVDKYKEVPLLISQLIKLLISPKQSSIIRYKIIGYYNMLVYELYNMLQKEKYLDVKTKDVTFHMERQSSIIEYINKHYLEKISLSQLAVHIGISKFRLSHIMKEMFGVSFREYLFNIRFEYALRLLRETDLSVVDIASLSGFSDIKYLNKLLKERFKTTALKYRKKYTLESSLNSLKGDFVLTFLNELRVCLKKFENNQLVNIKE